MRSWAAAEAAAGPDCTHAVIASTSRRSHWIGSAHAPSASTSFATVPIVPGSVGCGAIVFATTATEQPARASARQHSRPMPREPPVTIATLPLRSIGGRSTMCERSGPRPYCSVDRLGLGAAGPPSWCCGRWVAVESHRPSQPCSQQQRCSQPATATARALRAMLLCLIDLIWIRLSPRTRPIVLVQ